MLKKILSISGHPGLYKLISYGKNMLIVESLLDGKRIPAYSRDRVMSLGNISIYTHSEEVPLGKVLEAIFKQHDGKPLDAKAYVEGAALRAFFAQALPDYDEERVYTSDIKKVIAWYNILVENGITDFSTIDEEKAEEAAEEKKSDK